MAASTEEVRFNGDCSRAEHFPRRTSTEILISSNIPQSCPNANPLSSNPPPEPLAPSERSSQRSLLTKSVPVNPTNLCLDNHISHFYASVKCLVQQYVDNLSKWPPHKRNELGQQFSNAISELVSTYEKNVNDEAWRYLSERIIREQGFRASKTICTDSEHWCRWELVKHLDAVFREQKRLECEDLSRVGRENANLNVEEGERMLRVLEEMHGRLEQEQTEVGSPDVDAFMKKRREWVEEMERWRDEAMGQLERLKQEDVRWLIMRNDGGTSKC